MRKLTDLRPELPYSVRLKTTIKNNNVEEKIRGERGIKYRDFKFAAEAFNDTDIFRNPDKIGITIFYPNKESVTHLVTGFYPFDIDMVSLGLEINKLFEALVKKIPENLKTEKLKRKNKN